MWGSNFADWNSGFCGWGPSFGHGSWFIGWLFPLLFWGIIAYFVFSIIRYFFHGNRTVANDSAVEILRNRYASGEISEKEYTTQKATLTRN